MQLAKGIEIKELRLGDGREILPKDIVHFHCLCRLSKGDIAFTTRGDAPWQIRVGTRDSFVALDQGLIGMREGGLRQIKVPPHLTYLERRLYPNLPDGAILIYEIELIRVPSAWDNTLHIRESPIYSNETKALEVRWSSLAPDTDIQSEFQQVQAALFSHAQRELNDHRRAQTASSDGAISKSDPIPEG